MKNKNKVVNRIKVYLKTLSAVFIGFVALFYIYFQGVILSPVYPLSLSVGYVALTELIIHTHNEKKPRTKYKEYPDFFKRVV